MPRLIASKSPHQKGFTLIELLVVTMIIGIMAAIATPGLVGFVNRGKVSSAQTTLKGTLEQLQREAIKRSTNCSITFLASGQKDVTLSSTCLTTGSVPLTGVKIRHDLTTKTISGNNILTFNFRGETDSTLNGDTVIIITQEDSDVFQKCVAVSDGLGIIRMGNYSGGTTVDITKCTPKS